MESVAISECTYMNPSSRTAHFFELLRFNGGSGGIDIIAIKMNVDSYSFIHMVIAVGN